jgi:hypothetical protein
LGANRSARHHAADEAVGDPAGGDGPPPGGLSSPGPAPPPPPEEGAGAGASGSVLVNVVADVTDSEPGEPLDGYEILEISLAEMLCTDAGSATKPTWSKKLGALPPVESIAQARTAFSACAVVDPPDWCVSTMAYS